MRRTLAFALIPAILLPSLAAADMMAAVKRTKAGTFDTKGEIACAQEVGEALGTCSVAVARSGDAAAAVVVVFPNGFKRTLMFGDGVFVRGDATMSGVGTDTDWHLSGGLYQIRVDDQRFELPETLVFGD